MVQTTKYNKDNVPNIFVHEKQKILFCSVPKVASTTWKQVLMTLGDDTKTENETMLKHLRTYSDQEKEYMLKYFFKFMFVREPMERLYSAYRNKFVEPTPENSTFDFKFAFGRLIAWKYRTGWDNVHRPDGKDIKFHEFAQFITDDQLTSSFNRNAHWLSYIQLCHPCKTKYNVIGKYETLKEDSSLILHLIKADKTVTFPERNVTYHERPSGDVVAKAFEDVNREVVKKLWMKYRNDYTLFNYTFPKFLQDKMNGV